MALKLKLGRQNAGAAGGKHHGFGMRLLRFVLVCALLTGVIFAAAFGYYYHKYQQVVDDRLANGPMFTATAQIYAAPREVRVGQKLSAAVIGQELRQANYNSNPQLGAYQLKGDNILIKPGPQSYHSTDGATINTAGGAVQSITAENGVPLRAYKLEPLLITGLSEDKNRVKRRLVKYSEVPPRMVQAVVAIEDRRFFEHSGVDYVRIGKCAIQDVLSHRMSCGGSTLTQQLARGFFLTPEKHIKRKLIEILITFQLEAHFNKQQIFEMYANEINIGQRGSYAVNGIGEAAQAYFGKDLKQLDIAECATIAGMIQSPNRFNPYRHPDRVIERRNVVLDSMVETGAISPLEGDRAKAEGLHLAPQNVDASEAPYFVDLVHDEIVQRLGDRDVNRESLRIYTSLDPDLQRAATEAVEESMKNVDDLVRKLHRNKGEPITYPQVALVALDPHTGQVLALVGGRNYGVSQLNHAVANRPTGSIFKPIVYAAAYNTSLNGVSLDGQGTFTALTRLNDDPQDFGTPDKPYIPGNFLKGEYPGMVPAYQAIAHSLNIATIALAQQLGYENVAALARSTGIASARGTPSVAIGAYSATPIDMAGVYTVFANNGVHLNPWLLASVRNQNGDVVTDFAPEARQVLDPRVAFLTQSMLEGVINFGTAMGVRARGFTPPAAGKTGTEHDAWFAGYTSNLLCIIWVGNDDYTDISHGLTHKLQGADTAAPIWTDFMIRAVRLPQYSDTKSFVVPDGVEIQSIDRNTDQLADSTCPTGNIPIAFLDGTVPTNTCSRMSDDNPGLLQKIFGSDKPVDPSIPQPQVNTAPGTPLSTPPGTPPNSTVPAEPKKKSFLQKVFGGGDNKKQAIPPPPPQ